MKQAVFSVSELQSILDQAVAAGDRQVRFIDGSELFQPAGEAYCTVDGCHPNDLGFYLMFRRTLPVLREMLGLS